MSCGTWITLARVIFPLVKKYRRLYDRKNGYTGSPIDFAMNPFEPLGSNNDDRLSDWLIGLDKMIYSFEWIAKRRNWNGPMQKEFFKQCQKVLRPYKKELKNWHKKLQRDSKISKAWWIKFSRVGKAFRGHSAGNRSFSVKI